MNWVVGIKKIGVSFCLTFASLAFAAPSSGSALKNQVELVKAEFLELSGEMPYGSILYGQEEPVRQAYRDANNTLNQALAKIDGNLEEARPLLLKAYNQYRVVGLLMPFYAIKKEMRETIMQRWLRTLDLLATGINTVAKPVTQPTLSAPWFSGGTVWIHIGRMTHAVAETECPKQKIARAGAFQLPKFADLAAKFRDMKTPEQNPAFGTAATRFAEVWMADPSEIKPNEFTYLHFGQEKTDSAPGTSEFDVVCVAPEANR